jgi:biotin transport system substrate-specific component
MHTITASNNRSSELAAAANSLPGKIVIGLAATAVVAAAAHVAIPLPFTPVPLTLQPLAVLGVGLALGPAAGFLTMLTYLLEGALGLPVFSPTGPGGLAQLLGPTGGFLMAYPFVAALAGDLTRLLVRRIPGFLAAAIGCTAAVTLLFVCGAGWLMHMAHLSVQAVWVAAVGPFLPGEAIKICIAAGIYRAFARSRASH